jgi:serine phosphatase RsbU (regulator of sigma subunit)
MRKYFFLFCILVFSRTLFSQPTYTQKETEMVSQLKVLRRTNLDSARWMASQIEVLGSKSNNQSIIGLSYRLLADAYGNFDLTDSAVLSYNKAIQYFIGSKDSFGLADCYNNYSGILKEVGNINQALEIGNKALNLYEALFQSHPKDSTYYFLQAYAYNQIAVVYMATDDPRKAIPLLKKSLVIHFKGGNNALAYRCFLNLAALYEEIDLLDSSLYYYKLSIPYFQSSEDIEALLISYNNIGSLFDKKGDSKLSTYYYEMALQLSKKHDAKRQVAQSLVNLSMIDLKNSDYTNCIDKLKQAENIALSIEALDFLKNIYNKLRTVYAFSKDRTNYEKYENRFDSLTNVLLEGQSAKLLLETEKKFETQKKDLLIKQQMNAIELASVKNQQKNYFIYGGLFAFIVVSLLGFSAYRNYKKVTDANSTIQEQNEQLNQSNIAITQKSNELELKNTEILQSIMYSKYLQNAILPKEEDIKRISKINFIKYQPKDIVSGDYYWTYHTPNGLSIWATMDCTGHGVPGAMMSMLGISLLNEIVIEKHIYQPNEILNRMREKIITALSQNKDIELRDGMDGSICVWNKLSNTLSYASANSTIWVFRSNEFLELESNKMPIGKHIVMDPFQNFEFPLQSGDWIVSMSDGLADQFGGPDNKKLKYKRVRDFLNLKLEMAESNNITMDLESFYNDWKGMNDQTDDVTVLGIKI